MADFRYITDATLISYMRTAAHEVARLPDQNPEVAPLLAEGAKRIESLLQLVETLRAIVNRS